jgi:multidrug efflux pump subunit AcrA (membrane-fusion protein)
MSGNVPGPRELALRQQRTENAREIFDGPEACNRIKNLSDTEIEETRTKAHRSARQGRPKRSISAAPPTPQRNLTDADKAAIAELKKAERIRQRETELVKKRAAKERLTELRAQKAARRPPEKKPETESQSVTESAPAAQTEEADMAAKKTKTTTEAKTSKAKSRTAVKGKTSAKKTEGVRPGSKLAIIVGLLKRKEGCTTKDVLAATGWPAVSMPQQAKAAGLTLKKEKADGVTRYRAA